MGFAALDRRGEDRGERPMFTQIIEAEGEESTGGVVIRTRP